MILTAIVLLPFSTALEIMLDSPDSVELDEEFITIIGADSSDTFDVKIFVHNSEDEEIKADEYISEIYDSEWSNPWFYLKESFPGQKEYKIKIISSPGNRKICARFRKSDTKTTNTECNTIIVLETESTEQESLESLEQTKTEEKQIGKLPTSSDNPQNKLKEIALEDTAERITLNSPQTNPNQEIISTKLEKKRTGILYSFLALCILIIVLLALRRL